MTQPTVVGQELVRRILGGDAALQGVLIGHDVGLGADGAHLLGAKTCIAEDLPEGRELVRAPLKNQSDTQFRGAALDYR